MYHGKAIIKCWVEIIFMIGGKQAKIVPKQLVNISAILIGHRS